MEHTRASHVNRRPSRRGADLKTCLRRTTGSWCVWTCIRACTCDIARMHNCTVRLPCLGPTTRDALAGKLSRLDRRGRRCPPGLSDRSKKKPWGIAGRSVLGTIVVSVGANDPSEIAGISGEVFSETRTEVGVQTPTKPTTQRKRYRRASPLRNIMKSLVPGKGERPSGLLLFSRSITCKSRASRFS